MDLLGNRLKELRDSNNITISELSSRSGIGQSTISEIETGKAKNPKGDTIKKLAEVFDVTVDYLMGVVPFKNKIEAQHSILVATVKFLKENPDKRPEQFDQTAFIGVMVENNIGKEIMAYCEHLLNRFDRNDNLTDLELLELSNLMFSSIKWSPDYDGMVYLQNHYDEVYPIKLDFEEIEKLTLDLSKSYLLKITDNDQLEFEEAPILFDITGDNQKGKNISYIRDDGRELTEKDIFTLAAHKVGHTESLTDEELEKIKLAIKIALANNQ